MFADGCKHICTYINVIFVCMSMFMRMYLNKYLCWWIYVSMYVRNVCMYECV